METHIVNRDGLLCKRARKTGVWPFRRNRLAVGVEVIDIYRSPEDLPFILFCVDCVEASGWIVERNEHD